ncbi:hypothetical protein TNCV_4812591 [Trichonephila clavipes]|nr:hypothetical protein TNCV_4812591 [Trichonephila clavipes]
MVSWDYLWPTLRCRRVAGVSPVNRLVGTSLRSPRRDTAVGLVLQIRGVGFYLVDPRPDAVALYSGCTSGKRRAWFCQMTGTLPPSGAYLL